MNSERPRRAERVAGCTAHSDAEGPTAESHAQATVRRLERLQRHLSWLSQRRLARDLAADGRTPPQFFVLSWLCRCGPAPIHELAEATFQIPATMTGIVDRLQTAGLVSRERDPRDRRVVRVSITRPGRDLVGRVRGQQQARFREAASALSPRGALTARGAWSSSEAPPSASPGCRPGGTARMDGRAQPAYAP